MSSSSRPYPDEVQHRVLEDRRVPVGQHETVAVGPLRVGRIVLHDPAEEHVGERGERHRRALVAAVGLERGVHREAADERDGLLGLVGRQRRGHRSDCTRRLPGDTRVCQATGGSRVNGTRCQGPRSTRQWANTVAVVGELELAAHEPVGELAGLDGERADVAGDRLGLRLRGRGRCGRSPRTRPDRTRPAGSRSGRRGAA